MASTTSIALAPSFSIFSHAAAGFIQDVGRFDGKGGVIAVSRDGEIAFAWNSEGMKRAGVGPDQPLFAATF